jgi:organic radical activating enzyme
MARRSIDPSDMRSDLMALARNYHTRSLRLLGGEPLLHRNILSVIEAARQSRVSDEICVVTNGVLLPRMGPEFWQAVDRVVVSLYPGYELNLNQQHACEEMAQANGATVEMRQCSEFRESYSEHAVDDTELVQAIYDTCLVAHDWRCHTVADGRFYKCPQSYFIPKVVEACAGNQIKDSILIRDTESFRDELYEYLCSCRPLQTCGYCLGTSGLQFPHAQTRRSQFRDLQYRSGREMLDPDFLETRSIVERNRK